MLCAIHVTLLLSFVTYVVSDVTFYVSPRHGSDSNNGLTVSTPFKSLDHAVQVSTYNSHYTSQNIVIELMEGYHDLQKTLYITRNKITIRAYNNQQVHVTGGKRIDSSQFKHVTDHTVLTNLPASARSHVRVVHLPDVGITNYGTFSKYGFAVHRTAPLEVFYNSRPLHVAQWPNEGFINIVSVVNNQTKFRYNSHVPETWGHESNPWVYGYWYWSWADRAVKVTSLDTASMTVTLAEPALYGLRTGHWGEPDAPYSKQGGYFRFVNILSALDQPGEYYMDTLTGNLYAWMPNSDGNVKAADSVYVSLLQNCISLNRHVRDIKFEGFTLEFCRGQGITGRDNTNIQAIKMEIRNIGNAAISLVGDTRDCTMAQCLIHETDGGIYIHGGNRKTLESSGNIIEDCEIFNFSRYAATSSHAIEAIGVGHLVRYNHIYNGQYSGVWYYGNDITMEYNLLHHVCMNASDCGGFHTGRDWTTRGNIIRNNIIHDVLRLVPGADCRGIMLDDQSSSTSITNNVFYNNDVHANIGGGRDNIISYNVMYNATKASIQVDHRGMGVKWYSELQPRLHNMPYTSSAWTLRYPQVATLSSHDPNLPEGNQIVENIVYNRGGVPYILQYDHKYESANYFNVSNTGVSVGKTDHYNVDFGDLRIRCLAAAWANTYNFPQVVSPNDVGPRTVPGPVYVNRGRTNIVQLPPHNTACTTLAPATNVPVPAYLPDGSRPNDLYNVTNQGCWLDIQGCSNHKEAIGFYEDHWGETHVNAGNNETMCHSRAVQQWQYCGSHVNEQVAAIYGPTGSTVLAGDGCFMAMYGCPKHGGPADGHVTTGKIYRDTYAEQQQNAAHNEEACLSRAHAQWIWCGSNRNHPVTSIYRPTGAVRTAGAGCWIHVEKCAKHPQTKSMFYDAWGATNYHSDDNEDFCFHQAEYYWTHCGSDHSYPVTANFRPSGHSKTYP